VRVRLPLHLSLELDGLYHELEFSNAFVEPNGTLKSVSQSPVLWRKARRQFHLSSFYQGSGQQSHPRSGGGQFLRRLAPLHGGFRMDGNLSPLDSLTVQGDIYSGNEVAGIIHTTLDPPGNVELVRHAGLSGGNVLGRWNHTFSNGSDATLQFYFDRNARNGPESNEIRNTVDFDFQHRMALGSRHDVIWGMGYRRSGDSLRGTIDLAYLPAAKTIQTRAQELYTIPEKATPHETPHLPCL
jgi:hypothetical protein